MWVCAVLAALLAGGVALPAYGQSTQDQSAEQEQASESAAEAQQDAQSAQEEAPKPAPAADGSGESFQGYDFGQVVETMESSVSPLQREMNQSFDMFTDTVQEAEKLLEEGKTQEAVQKASAAIDAVLKVREEVLGPMWEGQRNLTEQTAKVRARLARAVSAKDDSEKGELSERAERTLDNLAKRVANEEDPLRKKRLVAHYRTVRNLSRIRSMADKLSPDQRKLWMNVLRILDEAALAHQQVLMGSEVLFAQFEATSANLKEYLALMETVEGASELLQVVRGVDDARAGMSGFTQSMNKLQSRLSNFNQSVEQALQGRMVELEAQLDSMEPMQAQAAQAARGEDGGMLMPAEEDSELTARIERVTDGQEQSQSP
jgi:membrane-associated HD superfamily phosphohydrolase